MRGGMIHGMAAAGATLRPASSGPVAGPIPGRGRPGAVSRHLSHPSGGERGQAAPGPWREHPEHPRARRGDRRPAQGADTVRRLHHQHVVAKMAGRASALGLPVRQTDREADPADLRNLRFVDLDADVIGDWKAKMIAEGLAPQTINAYLSLLSTILNAAVDSDYLPRSPMRRKSQAGRAEAVKKEREPRREVWRTRDQLDRVAAAINPRYRALVLAAALAGLRWGELTAPRWDDLQLERPFDDGAVAGPERLRVVRALSDPGNCGGVRVKGPKTEAGRRTIALDQETVDAFLAHRQLVGDAEYVFTSPAAQGDRAVRWHAATSGVCGIGRSRTRSSTRDGRSMEGSTSTTSGTHTRPGCLPVACH